MTILFLLGILYLFKLDSDSGSKTSKALWVPVIWFLIIESRAVSLWLYAFGLGSGWGGIVRGGSSVDQYLEGSPLDRLVFSSLLVIGIYILKKRGPQVSLILRDNAPLILFFSYCAVSVLWSEYPDVAFKRWIKSLGDPVMVLIVLTEANRTAAIKQLLRRTSFLLMPLSVLFIKYYPKIGRTASNSWDTLFSGVTLQKNTLGILCVYCGLACLWRILEAYEEREDSRRHHKMLANGVTLIMTLWLFYMSNAMTSLSGFLMASTLMILTRTSRAFRKPLAVHFMVLSMIGVSLFAIFFDSSGSLVGSLGRNSSLTGRTDVWALVLRMAGNPIFGTGFESFWLGSRIQTAWDAFWNGLNEAHNGYLEVYLNLGWIGVGLLANVIFSAYRKIIAVMRRDLRAGSLWLSFFFGCLIYGLSEASFRELSTSWIFLLMASMALPLVSESPVVVRPRFGPVFSVQEREGSI